MPLRHEVAEAMARLAERPAAMVPSVLTPTAEQPAPTVTARSVPVLPLALALTDDVAMRAALEARAEVGIARYGVALTTHNGRSFARDAIEEALDLVMYLAGARAEDSMSDADRALVAACLRAAERVVTADLQPPTERDAAWHEARAREIRRVREGIPALRAWLIQGGWVHSGVTRCAVETWTRRVDADRYARADIPLGTYPMPDQAKRLAEVIDTLAQVSGEPREHVERMVEEATLRNLRRGD